ncbi:MAG: hydantoinase B/oxoprolinase family protein [Solirubrobacterales bacterium]
MTDWDGVNECYIPSDPLPIDPSLAFHTEVAEEIDPVTYEVIRSALWNINGEAADIIMRVSGSPIAQYAHDFNTLLLTEDAEYLYAGPYNLNLAVVVDLVIKWILEFRSTDPGIAEGDIFLSNDPFIGASHVTDTVMMSPLFVDGKLFCWTASTFHQYDLGGTAPGGYSPDARNRFEEADPIPPVKMVEGDGEVRRDLLDWYLRKSRTPQLLELDFRSQVAGCNYSKSRLHSLIETYGAPTVKAAMRKIIDDGERSFAARLKDVPDGRWTARNYIESAEPGDREIYPTVLTVTKEGERLGFDQEGTADQAGVLSISYAAWRSGVMPPLMRMLCDDTQYALGGALRRLDFRPHAGSIFCASHPAATGNPGTGILQAGSLTTVALSRMLSTVDADQQEVFAVAGTSSYPITALSGVDEAGNYFGTIHMEPMAGGLGAFRDADGEDTGGTSFDSLAMAPNVEFSEQYFPILYLYRREVPSSGGAGRFRGGNSGEFAYVPHRTDVIDHYTATAGCALPTSLGLWGGYPGSTNRDVICRGTDVWARLRGGRIPQRLEELSGETEYVPAKERGVMLYPDDVWEMRWCAGAGFGDPLERPAELVAADVAAETVRAAEAERFYGVIVSDEGVLDESATSELRERRLQERLAAGSGEADQASGKLVVNLGPTLKVVDGDDGEVVACRACGTSFGALAGWKSRAIAISCEVDEVVHEMAPPKTYIDVPVRFHSFCCPGCGRGVDCEVTAGEDEPLADIALRGAAHPS